MKRKLKEKNIFIINNCCQKNFSFVPKNIYLERIIDKFFRAKCKIKILKIWQDDKINKSRKTKFEMRKRARKL